MPYTKPPAKIKALPKHAQDIWVAAFNAAWDEYDGDEAKANATAWTAVKKQYEQDDKGKWRKKTQTEEAKIYVLASGGAPEWIRLLPMGEVVLGDDRDPFSVTDKSILSIIATWEKRGNDLVIDYEHQTVTGSEAPAAGWVKELSARDDGLWARVEWTERAQRYIETKEYRYFSPVVVLNEKRQPTELLHAALTNFPAITNLTPLTAKDTATGGNENKEIENMEKLKKWFGLEDSAGEDEIIALVDDRQKKLTQALGLPLEAAVNEMMGAILALKQSRDSLASLQEEVAALKSEMAAKQAMDMVESAIKEGKVIPGQRDWALEYARSDRKGFEAFVTAAPKVVPLGKYQYADDTKDEGRLAPDEVAMCKALGVSEENFMASKKQLAEGGN